MDKYKKIFWFLITIILFLLIYSGFFYNYTLDRHAKVKENKNLSIEIKNDLLCNEKDIKKWCDILIKSITTS